MRLAFVLGGVVSSALAACTDSPSPVPPDVGADTAVDAAPDATVDAPPGDAPPGDAAMDAPRPTVRLVAESVDTRVATRDLMLASIEMQQSGEPLAETYGRDLAGYDRYALRPDRYQEPLPDGGLAAEAVDLAGYAAAIESYEYSKMHMNMLAFESSAGVSLAYGPRVNPTNVTGDAAHALLRDRVQRWALASHAGVRATPGGPQLGFVAVPPPSDNPLNTLGFGGFWPTLHPYVDFQPTVRPSGNVAAGCSLTSGYGASAGSAQLVGDYECGYSTLHIVARGDPEEVRPVISPGASGWAGWKYGFWVVNYLQIMHDVDGNPIAAVPAGDEARVGSENNTITGTIDGTTDTGAAGTFLGSSDVEGFQAAWMIAEVDDQAHQWLTALTTTDGRALSGFASLREALDYDYQSPLRWLPGAIEVTERREATTLYRPTAYAIASADSELLGLLGLLGSYAEFYALTDRANADVGGAQTARVYFDGDPFPADNQRADAEDTLHDRALAMMKLALVSLDRLHRAPAGDVLVDRVAFPGAAPARGATVATTSAAYAVVALRTARRSLSSNLTLYSNDTPDTAVTRTPLDDLPLRGAPGGATLTARLTALLRAHAELLHASLTTSDGVARGGWNVETRAPTAMEGDLEAHAAAVRGLLEAFLATGESRYRDRAEAVFQRMDRVFYSASARAYRATAAADAPIEFTPLRFGLLQGALREVYKLIAARPGREALAALVQQRITRLNKLVLNGWDDRDGDDAVDWPSECVHVREGLPRGGLQLAERALTGETGNVVEGGTVRPTSDRDRDCVPEIDDALLHATLGARVRLRAAP